ncbi:MAG TPA: HAMP domain-containing sensor histidine kinase [Acidobacteriaceae bacterium]|jgi:signal transduction histidine kinase|nr:HAMP domain-containing sensor histidine kinase [Acidobacteriaceae bacterium]
MKKVSLVRQVIAGVLLAELLCAALFSAIAVGHEMHGRLRAFDVMLRGRADSVLGAVRDADDPADNVTVDPAELQLPKQDLYVVLDPTGRVLGKSSAVNAQIQQMLSQPQTEKYFAFRIGDAKYRAIRLQGMRFIDREDNGGIRRPVLIVYAAPTQFLWREALEAVRFYLISGIVLLTITGVALAWFLRRRLYPLEELAAIAGGVSARSWEFAPPNAVLRSRELAPIAESISQLLNSLRAAFDRQRQLTGDAAHELKTSIAVLKSSLQLLTLAPRRAHEYERGLEGLLLDTERTEELATRMLALARLEEAPAAVSEAADLADALGCVLDRLRPLAELKDVHLRSTDQGPAAVPLAPDDAEVLCSNLLMNALQHTSPKGHIVATLHNTRTRIELRVMDDGEGIPEAALPHIFERFYRADSSRSRQSGGAGLGLSICKAMVDRAQGSIEVRSTFGLGTDVTVTLPRAAAEEGDRSPAAQASAT